MCAGSTSLADVLGSLRSREWIFGFHVGRPLPLIGESGSGKTTLARCLARVEDPDSGEICFEGRDVTQLPKPQLACVRRRIQLVFQHSATAMNPHLFSRRDRW